MSMPLVEALEQVDLHAGRTYCCRVKGRLVEVRVHPIGPPQLAKPLSEADVMLDPWVDLPGIGATHHVTAPRRVSLPFDVPRIPSD